MNGDFEDRYPLTSMQEGMIFHTLLEQRPEEYCEQVIVDIAGTVDIELLRRAWHHAASRHAALRTAFVWEDLDEPLQVVYRSVDIELPHIGWRGAAWLESLVRAERLRGFTLSRAPLMRLMLIESGAYRCRLVWSFHHAILDGWSAAIVLGEVVTCYRAFLHSTEPTLGKLPLFKEYVVYVRSGEDAGAQAYWREKLAGYMPHDLGIIGAQGRVDPREECYGSTDRRLPADLVRRIEAFARREGLNVDTVWWGAWALLLGRYGARRDVTFGNVFTGRSIPLDGVESVVGVCINTLPVRVGLPRHEGVRDWLHGLRDEQLRMRRFEMTPLVKVHEWAGVQGGRRMFDTIVAYQDGPFDPSLLGGFRDLEIVSIRHIQSTNYPLTLITPAGTDLMLRGVYDRRSFDGASIGRMLEQLEVVLGKMMERPDARLSEIPVLSDSERHDLVIARNDTFVDFGTPVFLHTLFEAQVERSPDHIAVSSEHGEISFQELNERANRLAHHLMRSGVGPDCMVGICIDRSIELIIAILAVLKAGGAYLPLNPEYPHERLAFIVNDSEIALVLTDREGAATVYRLGPRIIRLDAEWAGLATERGDNPAVALTQDNLAYTAYTSGSTGTPKGAMNTHGGIANRLCWMMNTYPLGRADHLLQKTPFSFDVSVWEFFWPLVTGARLVMAVPQGHRDSTYILRTIDEQEITVLHFVPSMLQVFLEEEWNGTCRSVTDMFCSGEALTPELRDRFFRRIDARLHNLYGPVEAAVEVTFWQCVRDGGRGTVPIGRPISNVRIYLLGEDLEPVPVGVQGEIYIGGVAIARGYLNRPDLTASRFIPDPFGARSGARMYRTGDLAWLGGDGAIVFRGRIDDQVKVRGFRVEPGEIEVVLMRHPAVREAVVTAREDIPGDLRLVAYAVPKRDRTPTIPDLRRFLAGKLPVHMMPSFFLLLERLPLLPSGKVNRRDLPPPEFVRPDTGQVFVAPRTRIEEALAGIWSRTLGLERIGVHDDFFELGGHSLLATRLVSRIRQRLNVDIPLRMIFERATIAELAGALGEMRGGADEIPLEGAVRGAPHGYLTEEGGV